MVSRLVSHLSLSVVHLAFYVLILKLYHHDDSYVIQWYSIILDRDLNFEGEPITIWIDKLES